jgi:hypothetical protein
MCEISKSTRMIDHWIHLHLFLPNLSKISAWRYVQVGIPTFLITYYTVQAYRI